MGNKKLSLCQLVAMHLDHYFTAHDGGEPESGLHARLMNEIEYVLFCKTLESVAGNKLKAAKILGINRNTFSKKMAEYEIKYGSLIAHS